MSRPKQTTQLTSCKRFDNYCYHPQCIAKKRCQLYRVLWPWYLL